jgi:hypothetical protein
MARDEDKKKPGPDPERLKLPGDWKDRIKDALGKKRPPEGWTEPSRPDDEPPGD